MADELDEPRQVTRPATKQVVAREDALVNGWPSYYTGRPCSRGHYSERRTLSYGCLACIREDREHDKEVWKKAKKAVGGGL